MVRHDRRPPCSLVRHCYYARGGTGLYYGPLANQTLGTPSPPPPSRGPHAIGPEPGPPATGATRAHTHTRSGARIYLSGTHAHAATRCAPLPPHTITNVPLLGGRRGIWHSRLRRGTTTTTTTTLLPPASF